VRLDDVRQAFGERVRIHWRTFPLLPDHRPGRLATAATQEGRRRAGADEPRAAFVAPARDTPLPASSVPALTAAKCAERQGEEPFRRFHARLFLAQFRDNADISRPEVLRGLARDAGLDLTAFEADYAGEAYQAMLRDYAEGAAWFGVSALPTVVFNEKLSLVGAVPTERYRLLVEWILAGEPGGTIPLEPAPAGAPPGSPAESREAGQSAVGGQAGPAG
jgi:predicted DsbA family dithiol-disulfide isomerase